MGGGGLSASVAAVCISPGGIPKHPVSLGRVARAGLVGDGRNHAKHIRPDVLGRVCEARRAEANLAEATVIAPERCLVEVVSVPIQPFAGAPVRLPPVPVKPVKPRAVPEELWMPRPEPSAAELVSFTQPGRSEESIATVKKQDTVFLVRVYAA